MSQRVRLWVFRWLWTLNNKGLPLVPGFIIRCFASSSLPSRAAIRIAPADAPGFNVVGFISAEMGLGQHARNLIAALRAAGYAVRTADVSYLTHGPCADRRWSDLELPLEPRWPVIHLYNPDVGILVIQAFGADHFARFPRHIAIWNWELESLPSNWARFAGAFDEVWAASRFTAQAVAQAVGRPCPVVPIPVLAEETSGADRTTFRLPQGRFLFLFMFDMNSALGRKNPQAVLAAFQAAFPEHRPDGPALVIKVFNGKVDPSRMAELRRESVGGSIYLIDRPLARGEVLDLQRCCDCFVSLHRAEGFGLGPAEAMRLGKPVIATRWSGTAEFINEDSSLPISSRLIPVDGVHGPYIGQRWADPDHSEAVAAMQRVVAEAGFRERIAVAGQQQIEKGFSLAAIGSLVKGRMLGNSGAPEEMLPDPSSLPLISIVTASYNQGRFIEANIRSVLDQAYPRIEHIIVDGCSTDDTMEVLAKYPHLVVIREKDGGQADAINKGFRRSTGDILCFLNSDDTFEPGALTLVAQHLGPSRRHEAITGRCRYIDTQGHDIGLEHISHPFSHSTLLRPWFPHPVPQPSTFWTRRVYQAIGELDANEQLVLDQEFVCRLTRQFQVQWIDQVLSTYRLHPASKTTTSTAETVLLAKVRVVRPLWGRWWSPRRWWYEMMWLVYHVDHAGRTLRHLRSARNLVRDGRVVAGLMVGALGLVVCPWRVLPRVIRRIWGYRGYFRSRLHRDQADLQDNWFRSFHAVHPDGWIGPQVLLTEPPPGWVPGDGIRISLNLPAALEPSDGEIRWRTGNGTTGAQAVAPGLLHVLVPGRAEDGAHVFPVHLSLTPWFIPDEIVGNRDFRPLVGRLIEVKAEPQVRF